MDKNGKFKVLIRPFEMGDLPALPAIERESRSDPWPESLFAESMTGDDKGCLIAQVNSQVAGFICWQRVVDEAEVHSLSVAKSFRRRGIATTLLGAMAENVSGNGVSVILLEVSDRNMSALDLYERFGFCRNGVRSGYYPDGSNAILMSKPLNGEAG